MGSPAQSPEYGIAVIYSLIVVLMLPFLIGFLISFIMLKRILSHKSGRYYVKSTNKRLILMLTFATIVGFSCFYILYTLRLSGYL